MSLLKKASFFHLNTPAIKHQLELCQAATGSIHYQSNQDSPLQSLLDISAMRGTWKSANNYFEDNDDQNQQTCKRCQRILQWSRSQQILLLRLEKNLIEKQQNLDTIMKKLQIKAQETQRQKLEINQRVTNFFVKLIKSLQKYQVSDERKQYQINPQFYKENKLMNQRTIKKTSFQIDSPIMQRSNNGQLLSQNAIGNYKQAMNKIQNQINKILFENSTLKSYNETLLEKLRISKKNKF